ncbi:MAG TPA: RNA polymerase sigma factor [Blastocatellia bacterium]|nr:RNA polymerase sigma factor [Blastocatellia bacterium]
MNKAHHQIIDEELLRRMLAGDRAAFGQLYERWQSAVYRFTLRMSGSEAVAEDVTQETFLTLMRDGRQYQGRGTFAAYLFTIAHHSVLRHLRRERRFVAIEEDENEEQPTAERMIAADDPLADLTRDETLEAVRQAILALPVHYREVVLLCHLHELSYAEAAEVIGCEIGTVRSRLHRARALLTARLKKTAQPDEAARNLHSTRCFA